MRLFLKRKYSTVYARKFYTLPNHDAVLDDPDQIAVMRENLAQGDVYILKNAVAKEKLLAIREYLADLGRHSFPTYEPIEEGSPNFHRVNRWDPRAYVKGCFHQFSFFPWNQDLFGMFEVFRNVFALKNALTGVPADKFLNGEPDDGCIARLSYQFYPAALGEMNKHEDPVNHHQISVTLLTMSKKGEDFHEGGLYLENEDGEHVSIDDLVDYGDVIHANAQIPHGVERIDPKAPEDWLSFRGRWLPLCAVNKVKSDTVVQEAVDLGSS